MTGTSNKTVLITGASGLLGRYAVTLLRELGFTPVVVDLRNSNPVAAIDTSRIAPLALFHLAAQRPRPDGPHGRDLYETNLDLTRRTIEVAKRFKVRQWIMASSVSVYGDLFKHTITELSPTNPQGPYAESKLASEVRISEEARATGATAVLLRFSHMYGLGEKPDFLLSVAIHNAAKGMPIGLSGRGSGRRNLLYALDAARALTHSLAASDTATVNILGPRNYSNLEAALLIAEGFGRGSRVFHDAYEEDVPRTELVESRCAHRLHFEAVYPLERAVEHMKNLPLP